MRPAATYRLQLHADFGFDDAADLAGYLAELGVTHLYCSPYLQAAPGSTHGYDVVDPQQLNDELGGAAGHARLTEALRLRGLGQVLDIVPNHMSTDPANRWWWDVLENGPSSRYARFFDIDWLGPDGRSAYTVLVPVLADQYGRVLEKGEIEVARTGGEFVVRYHEHRLPLSPRTSDDLLARAAARADSHELSGLADAAADLPPARATDPEAVDERHRHKLALAADLAALTAARADYAHAIDAEVAELNRDVDRLDELLRRQNYRLAHWRVASEELDYRRFFNIESLVGIRVEDPHVFDETHRLVLRLVREGVVDGLRIDHVDGLRDPAGYLKLLASRVPDTYVVVEKILEPSESLPSEWPVAGTSGYDFLIRTNNLFVASGNEAEMTAVYADFTGEQRSYADIVRAAKHQIMRSDLAAELERVTGLLAELVDMHRRHRDHTRSELRSAITEFVADYPVYRTYFTPGTSPSDEDERHVATAVNRAHDQRPDLDGELFEFLGALALGHVPGAVEREFTQRLQQLTAPVMAKGVEDTAFYRYHRLISLNEVGGDPGVFGRSLDDFHDDTARTAQRWPHAMLTLSTHDTKRSADVRARLNALSEVPEAWNRAVHRWAAANEHHWPGVVPDRNVEFLLYQTLVGVWPINAERVSAFMLKASKEAKVHTSWTDPNDEYDEALSSFVDGVLADETFTGELERFLATTSLVARGRRNSLAQTALLLTCPGVPDIYQGTEMWELSLVDPDNRRPVDYEMRRAALEHFRDSPPPLVGDDEGGVAKLQLTHRLLQHRRTRPDTFDAPDYQPLSAAGARADDIVAFERRDLVVVVPRLGPQEWTGTSVTLPPGRWRDLVTHARHDGGVRQVRELFAAFPVAVLARDAAR